LEITATLDAAIAEDAIINFTLAGTAKHNLDFTTAFLSKGTATTIVGGNGMGSAANQLAYPSNVSIDSDGNIYTLDLYSIKKWAPGANEGIIVVPTDSWDTHFFVDPSGNIYVSYLDEHIVKKWAIGATDWITVAGGNDAGSDANQLDFPMGLTVDTDGNIYIADRENHRIQKWAVDATEGITVAGGNGEGNAADQLYNPVDVSINSDGDIFVLDQNNDRIQKWELDAVAGSTVTSLSGYFSYFFVDDDGSIFLSDRNNDRVLQWLSVTNQWITIAGGNGAGSDANQLDTPLGITVDNEGNLFIAERNNYRIQRVQYAPQITILAGETEGNITIAGIDDIIDEYEETIEITPTTTINCTLNASDPISIAITDNDEMPSIAFSFSADKIKENSSTDVNLIATTSVVSGKDIEISFTIEGDALETDEYVLSSRGITILAGDTVGRLSISTNGLDDALIEVLKTIIFRVNSVTNATVETETASLLYESDDDPEFTISASKTTIAEHESLDITATLETATSKDAIIDFELAGTAKQDSDFTTAFLSRGTVTTVAGGNGYSTVTSQLDFPRDVVTDSDGNIYILEQSHIKKWDSEADEWILVAPTVYNLPIWWVDSSGNIFVDSSGNIYLSYEDDHIVKKWAYGAAEWITVAGGNDSGSAANQLDGPMGIWVDAAGNIYIADKNNHRIQKWAVGATEGITVAGGNGLGSAVNQFKSPCDVSVLDGDIFVLDAYNYRIQKWVEGEDVGVNYINSGISQSSEHFFVDDAGSVFVSDRASHSVLQWLSAIDQWITIAGGNDSGSDANQLSIPGGISVDEKGNLFVADIGNNRIQKVQYAPQITVKAGETEGKLTISGIEDYLNDEGDESIIVKTISAENAVLETVEDISITLLDNTKALTLQENPFIGLSNGAVSWGDYDRDGDMDVAVMGLSPLAGAITAVYENRDGTFVNTNQDFARLYEGDISWVDINKDGWIDLVVSGLSDAAQTKLYLNNEGVLEATDDYGLPQLYTSKMAWGDLDNDGDIDLAISGINSDDDFVFYIYYREDNQDSFIREMNMSSSSWPGFVHGDLKIVDVDLDGDNDIIYSGENSNGDAVGGIRYNSYIEIANSNNYYYDNYNASLKKSTIEVARLRNAPCDSLSIISSGVNSSGEIILSTSNFSGSTDLFPKLKNGDIAIADFDNDGLNDIVFTGEDADAVPITKLFIQNSVGNFMESEIQLQGLRNSTANWVDYDMDGDLDLFLTGLDDNGAKTLLYEAETVNKVNMPPSVITGLELEDLGNGNVRFSWEAPDDDFSTNLGYVLRLGTTPGGTELSNTESDLETGRRLISKPAPVYTDFSEMQLDPGVYYWSVQAVDPGLKGGAFSEEKTFVLTYEWKLLNQGGIIDRKVNAVKDPLIRLADIDNDDDMDLIYGSTSNGNVQLFKYDGKCLMSGDNPFNVNEITDIAVGDINGDGITDVLFNHISYDGYSLRLYISNGSDFIRSDINEGLYKAQGRIVDLNNDGQAEVVLIGLSSSLVSGKIKFYIFEYDDTSVPPTLNKIDVSDQIASLSAASFDLGDIDNDQDIDLIMSGLSVSSGLQSHIYENRTEMGESYQFVAIENDLVATIEGTNNLIDFDGDGDLDALITGNSINGDVFEVFENKINEGVDTWTKLDNTGLIPMRLGKVDLGDFNGDGYSDLLYSGVVGGSGKVTNLTEFNPVDNTFIDSAFDVSDIIDADVEFGDLEGDGDLDFAISGESRTESGEYIFRAYVNVRNESALVLDEVASKSSEFGTRFKGLMGGFTKNDPPATPVANNVKVIDGVPVTAEGVPIEFSWSASSDDHTPEGGVTYAFKVGKTPGGEEIMSSNSNMNGTRKSAVKGNAEHNTSWRLRLPEGTYYWSVQAIDASYAGSKFTASTQFEVSATLGVDDLNMSDKILCYPNPTRGLLNIEVPGNEAKVNLVLRNLIGAVVYQENIEIASDRKVEFDISMLPSAMYMLSIETTSFNQMVKITKE
jgi:sugar lactone lactonase YvrE